MTVSKKTLRKYREKRPFRKKIILNFKSLKTICQSSSSDFCKDVYYFAFVSVLLLISANSSKLWDNSCKNYQCFEI